VRFELTEADVASYQRSADYLNVNSVDVVSVQHEFGIFGGKTGSHPLILLQALRMPIVTTTARRIPASPSRAAACAPCSRDWMPTARRTAMPPEISPSAWPEQTREVAAGHRPAAHLVGAYQRDSVRRRPPPLPPKPPPNAGFGRASLTVRLRPPSWDSFNSLIARSASSAVLISTKANPRARPVAASRITLIVST
jgi:hypothetical protein